jgi:hypothetical protein
VRDYRRREAEKARAFDLEGRLNRVLENVVELDDPRWRAINLSEPRVLSLKTCPGRPRRTISGIAGFRCCTGRGGHGQRLAASSASASSRSQPTRTRTSDTYTHVLYGRELDYEEVLRRR